MVAKRKSSAMALMQEDVKFEDPTPHSPVAEPREDSDFAPRRSGRNKKTSGLGLYPDANAGKRASSPRRTSQKRQLKKQLREGREGVDDAIDGLEELDHEFHDAAKRQKRAIIKSSLTISSSKDLESSAFLPKAVKPASEVIQMSERKTSIEQSEESQPNTSQQDNNGDGELKGEDAAEGEPEAEDPQALKQEGARPPPVNSDYLPLPWKGRLGYACLNTYLRLCNPPVFSSRTCRIASIIEHRHPLQDPSQPEHPTKNRPDKEQPADVARGQRWVESLGLANARDIVKMIRWNDKYGIKFMRLSSEMFPFASHEEYGYKLAPFASEVLAEAGRVAAELGHRLTTHPGQFTQLGSPRAEVVRNAVRDLEYHDEMLSLLRLPEQQNRDAVMILHMGGVFGDKAATLDRFRQNYARLSPSIKARIVLENDDVAWSVHDLLPICEELNIPLVLDYHHHNIIFDKTALREGTRDIMELYPRIKATWEKKGIKQKMHYSEPCAEAITGRQRRKHSARVFTFPPCANDMDLMIEAKDKEQAIFQLMRTYRLPGWDKFNDIVPYERDDDNRPLPKTPKKKQKRKKKGDGVEDENGMIGEEEEKPMVKEVIVDDEVGMGGPQNRVFWPEGMEEWLRPKKREVKKKANPGEENES